MMMKQQITTMKKVLSAKHQFLTLNQTELLQLENVKAVLMEC